MTRRWLGLMALAALALAGASSLRSDGGPAVAEEERVEGGTLDPMGPNAACYVCHMTFVREELAKTHLAQGVTCIDCHGLSAGHANDEDIGATKPDVLYERDQVSDSCRTCHETHDVAPELVVARWAERELTESPPVCTDCHGAHRIAQPLAVEE